MADWRERFDAASRTIDDFNGNGDETKEIIKRLKDAGIELAVGSCGCCDSPWVQYKTNAGEVVVIKLYGNTLDSAEE